MASEILLPAISPTMTDAKVVKWSKSVGDAVKPGDVLVEIESDKATLEIEAEEVGILDVILVPAGTEGVAVNTPLAILRGEDEAAGTMPIPSAVARAPVDVPTEFFATVYLEDGTDKALERLVKAAKGLVGFLGYEAN